MVTGTLGRMGIVAGMHLAAFYMIARSLGIVPTEAAFEPIQTVRVEPERMREDPPPRTDPSFERTVVYVPEPEPLPRDAEPRETITGEVIPPARPRIDEGGSADPVPLLVGARMDTRHPLSQPPYPSPDIRLGNEGNTDVEVYVLANGRVGEARIARSSGFERLDQSALEEARRNWRLLPATRDGQPIAQWYKVRVTFKLKKS